MSDAVSKVTAGHLRRDAYLYVRQSTLYQVANNTESTRRQYDLRGRAVALGWPAEHVITIDVDQGQSGASAADREGFQHLVAEVSLGKAGIVLGLECSRLARNNADWHRLLQICAFNNTLILDEDGLYDPCNFNDRLLLGLKGTMSEAELYLIRARLRGGILAKAARGELALPLPAGLVYDAAGQVALDPDAGVRRAVQHLFDTFAATGSARAVVKAFRAENLSFPMHHQSGPHAGELYWTPLTHARVLNVLHNPRYAGAYCYGRSRHYQDADGRYHTIARPRDQWITLIPGAHPGYLSFAQYEANLAVLAANAAAHGEDRKAGPAREGPALLQGLAVCGKCGRRMTVRYHTRTDGTCVPDYVCQAAGIAARHPDLPGHPRGQHRHRDRRPDPRHAHPARAGGRPDRHRRAHRPRRPGRPDPRRARRARPARRRRRPPPLPGRRPRQPARRRHPRSGLERQAPRARRRARRLQQGLPRQHQPRRHPARAHPRAGRRFPRPVEQPRHPDARAQAPDPAADHRRHPDQDQRRHHRRTSASPAARTTP